MPFIAVVSTVVPIVKHLPCSHLNNIALSVQSTGIQHRQFCLLNRHFWSIYIHNMYVTSKKYSKFIYLITSSYPCKNVIRTRFYK